MLEMYLKTIVQNHFEAPKNICVGWTYKSKIKQVNVCQNIELGTIVKIPILSGVNPNSQNIYLLNGKCVAQITIHP